MGREAGEKGAKDQIRISHTRNQIARRFGLHTRVRVSPKARAGRIESPLMFVGQGAVAGGSAHHRYPFPRALEQ